MLSNSPRFALNFVDLYKAARGAVLVLASLFVLGGLENLLAWAQKGELCATTLPLASSLCNFDFAQQATIAVTTFLLESARRFFADHTTR